MKFSGIGALKDPVLRELFRQLEAYTRSLEQDYGIVPNLPGLTRVRAAAPPLGKFKSITGGDGRFLVQIENPTESSGPILHEISTASTIPFISALDIQSYGPSLQTSFEIFDPNVTKYIRLRSRYINSGFNASIISAAVFSGILGLESSVQAGLIAGTDIALGVGTKDIEAILSTDLIASIVGGTESVDGNAATIAGAPRITIVSNLGFTLTGSPSLRINTNGSLESLDEVMVGDPILVRQGSETVVDSVTSVTSAGSVVMYSITPSATGYALANNIWVRF